MLKINYSLIFKILIISLLAFVAVFSIDYRIFIEKMSFDLVLAMIFSQIAILPAVFFMSLRLAIFSNKKKPPVLDSFKSIFLSMGFNIVVPGRLSEFVKPFYLKTRSGVPIESGLCAVFLERITDMFILAFFAALVLSETVFSFDVKLFMIIPVIIFVILFLLPKLSPFLKIIIEKIKIEKIVRLSNNVLFHLEGSVQDRNFFRGIGIGFIGWLFSMSSFIIFFQIAVGNKLSFLQYISIFIVSIFAYAIPALPAGVGTYEASIVFVLKTFGYGIEESILLALSLHLAQIIMICIVCSVIFFKEDMNIFDLVKKIKYGTANYLG